MAKKYFTDESLAAFVDEIKTGDAESLSSAKSYTDTEVAKITNGTTIVPEAEHATSADIASSVAWTNVTGKPSTYTPSSHNHAISDVTDLQPTIDTINTALDKKSYLKSLHSISANDGSTHYYKLITITPKAQNYLDMYYEFDVTARANQYTKIRIFVATSNDNKYINQTSITYEGSLGANFTAYKFRDTTNFVDRIEIWCKITAWDTLKFYPKTSQIPSNMSFTWNNSEDTALPTNATETIAISKKAWNGNASTATTASKLGTSTVGSSSQPIYLSSGTATKVSAVGIAYGGTGATNVSDARTNLEVYSTIEVDTALASKASSTHNHDSAYDVKGAADTALESAKTYADNAATQVKNDLLNGAGTAYDTLKELGDLIDDNTDAIDALEAVAASKQSTITGGASTITSSNLTANRALISNSSGKVAVSAVTSTELGYLDGVSSNIQTQLNNKADKSYVEEMNVIVNDINRDVSDTLNALENKVDKSSIEAYVDLDICTPMQLFDEYGSSFDIELEMLRSEYGWGDFLSCIDAEAAKIGCYTDQFRGDSDVALLINSYTLNEEKYRTYMYISSYFSLSFEMQITYNLDAETCNISFNAPFSEYNSFDEYLASRNSSTKLDISDVDSSLSTSSTNPIQNKVVATAINSATTAISANTDSISAHTTAITNLQTAVNDFEEITSKEIIDLFADIFNN